MSNLKTPNGRLREAGARAVLERRKDGKTYQEIATEIGISIGTVYNICTGRTWAWLREETNEEPASPGCVTRAVQGAVGKSDSLDGAHG